MYALSRTAGAPGAHRKARPPTAATTAPTVKARKRSTVVRGGRPGRGSGGPVRRPPGTGRGGAGPQGPGPRRAPRGREPGDLQPRLRAARGRGEGPDVGRVDLLGLGVRVRVGCPPFPVGAAGTQLLGVPALHPRSSGQEPDGGAEAFGGTCFVQLVLPAEPHRHQIGGPGSDDDCVDEAAAAHVSHGRGVGAGASANWAGVSHDLADITAIFVIGRIDCSRTAN